MRILLHTCCGPCTIYPLKRLRQEGWQVHGYFYNPHIQPYQEFEKRLATLESFAQREELEIIVRNDYELERFFRQVAFREHQRCIYCYAIRIEAVARLAKKSRFDAFTTTLLYSKRQRHDLVRDLAQEASQKYGIAFYYENFRKGWREGQELAGRQGMYRQQYCGCIYSERERYKAPAKSADS
jgi:predicted adenine nucleotide alpha hydrolase (AANH) superfamily ATPase